MVGQKRGPYKVGVQRRQRIIAAADRRFSTDGYHQTQVAAIAKDVGITDAGLLHHFPSKLHLLIAVSQHRFSLANESWSQLGDEPPFLTILASMWHVADAGVKEPARVELDVIAAAEAIAPTSLAHQEYIAGHNAAIADTAERFRVCLARGELHPWVEPEGLARECFAIGNGLNSQWIMSNQGFDLSETLLHALSRLAASAATDDFPADGPAEQIRALARNLWPDSAVSPAEAPL
ncbi:MAG: TetR/AcrR family transcriptional regulator [Propionibacteriaceae bacterium]|nr:TetR/AcrR family transcriptional regulator [Propionibacteriaceae bacterium]